MSKIVGELVAGIGVGLAPGKPLVARLGLAYTCQILARWPLLFPELNFQVQPKILPQKMLKRMLHLSSRRKENEGQLISRGIVRVNDSSGLTLLEPAFSPSYAGAILAGTDRMCRDSVEQMDRFPGYA